ncbi:MAG: tyrosine-type recombinase/integrase [Boseongicola sp. SB0664_bin_43]|uniref:Tyrosine-type recombinase/integrase n=1 Tax=Boseongicola sp. SB0664_bin_43 TaxID=2604844 RepID=A0A6B0Y4N3_9RHOB|nr:tyrosine-type recombinase/integrase [Boseongicola sp. SB0664_bin_43]
MTRRMRLTDAGIMRLRPCGTDYTVWDTFTPGLGVRVRTSGFRGYVFHERGQGGSRRVSLGPVTLKSVQNARKECLAFQLDEFSGEARTGTMAGSCMPLFRDYVADPWMAESRDRWKPSTRKFVDSLLRTSLLPAFGHLRLDRIAPAGVNAWFDRRSATAPGGANKALTLLRQIMNHAVAGGLIATNPARRTRMNPRPRLTRFLSAEEIVRLHEALDKCVAERPACEGQADIIRLLLYTGCRMSEIKNLKWSEVKADTLRLADSKTGSRTVYLSADARAVIKRQRKGSGRFVFPSPVNPGRPRCNHLKLWNRVRERAGLSGVRLHDTRHTYASQAVMKGVPLPVVARLLGHSHVRMTMRYAHVGDCEVIEAAERIGTAISRALDGSE